MFLACGVGAFSAGIFHLMTHAFFKALLFLAAGSVIHAMGGEQDMLRMGGLRKKIQWTYLTMLMGTLAIAGIPPLAGFFSKDSILLNAYQSESGDQRGHIIIRRRIIYRAVDFLLHVPADFSDIFMARNATTSITCTCMNRRRACWCHWRFWRCFRS